MQIFLMQHRALVSLAVAVVFCVSPLFAFAQNTTNPFPNTTNPEPNTSALNTPTCNGSACSVSNPLGTTVSFCGLIKKLFNALLPIVTAVAVLFIMWSGFRLVFAQGQPKALQRARQNFYYTILGVALFLGAWIAVEVIVATINAIGGSTIISCK